MANCIGFAKQVLFDVRKIFTDVEKNIPGISARRLQNRIVAIVRLNSKPLSEAIENGDIEIVRSAKHGLTPEIQQKTNEYLVRFTISLLNYAATLANTDRSQFSFGCGKHHRNDIVLFLQDGAIENITLGAIAQKVDALEEAMFSQWRGTTIEGQTMLRKKFVNEDAMLCIGELLMCLAAIYGVRKRAERELFYAEKNGNELYISPGLLNLLASREKTEEYSTMVARA